MFLIQAHTMQAALTMHWNLNWGSFPSSSPLISNSAQCDFFPLAASSEDIIVYILRGSGGSYFSLGIPVDTQQQRIMTC